VWIELGKANEVCANEGMSLEESKEVGPATAISFLRLEIDTMKMEVRLPEKKLGEL